MMENGRPSQTLGHLQASRGQYNKCDLFLVLFFLMEIRCSQNCSRATTNHRPAGLSKSMMHGQREGSNQICTFATVLHLNHRLYYLDMDGALTAVFELR